MDANNIEIAKTLAEAHLESIFDKYLVIGFQTERGDDFFTNCTAKQLVLMFSLFDQRLQQLQQMKISNESIN